MQRWVPGGFLGGWYPISCRDRAYHDVTSIVPAHTPHMAVCAACLTETTSLSALVALMNGVSIVSDGPWPHQPGLDGSLAQLSEPEFFTLHRGNIVDISGGQEGGLVKKEGT